MRIVIWVQSAQFQVLGLALGILNRRYGSISVLGLTNVPPSTNMKSGSFGVVIDKNDLAALDFDIIIVSGQDTSMKPVLEEAPSLGIDPSKIVLDRTVCIPGFTLEKYNRLRRSRLSILSRNCWGGLIYHAFGLQFLSPTVNLYTNEEDFIKLLEAPKSFLDEELRFYSFKFDEETKHDYPIMRLGALTLHMLHYDDAESARRQWEDRRLRINWYNLLVMTYTEDPAMLERFDRLPFAKKVCFVPFETEFDSGFYVDPELFRGKSFYEAVNEIASNKIFCFDLWDMLIYGKNTTLQINT